jgi:uncharacterized repeat protein (TIGR01451 family)
VTSVTLGSTVHDEATVTGPNSVDKPTGDVSFRWFTNGSCDGDGVAAGSASVGEDGGAHPSSEETPQNVGSYSFQATYAGDDNYNKSTGPCEPLMVTKGEASTVTTVHDEKHGTVTTVKAGTSVHDEATVKGPDSVSAPSGDVSFQWFTSGDCSGDGTPAGTVALADGVAHPSDSQTPADAGGYSFQATYNGDSNYNTSTGPCEPLTVTSVDLKITKADSGAVPVAGQGTFTYTLAVDNLGPSDAQDDATVKDVLPAEITFNSFGSLPQGVTCGEPVGQTITCTIAKGLLEVADGPVSIPVVVSVKAGANVASVTNKAIVTSPDDEAPCDVTSTDITCDETTNNYAQVVTPLTAVGGTTAVRPQDPQAPQAQARAPQAPAQPRAQGLAFTGSAEGRIAMVALALIGAGGIFLLSSRRRRKKRALG